MSAEASMLSTNGCRPTGLDVVLVLLGLRLGLGLGQVDGLWKMCRIVLMADNMADEARALGMERETNAASSEIEHKIFLIKNYFFFLQLASLPFPFPLRINQVAKSAAAISLELRRQLHMKRVEPPTPELLAHFSDWRFQIRDSRLKIGHRAHHDL